MSWGKVCDTLHAHHKPRKAGLEAMGLWVMALSWSRDKGTDGYIPGDQPRILADDDEEIAGRCVARLIKARLWEADPAGGWRFHDWDEIQRSTAEEEQKREEIRASRAAAGRLGGLAKASKTKQPLANLASPGNAWQALAKPGPLLSSPLPEEEEKSAPLAKGGIGPPENETWPSLAARLASVSSFAASVHEQLQAGKLTPTPSQRAALLRVHAEHEAKVIVGEEEDPAIAWQRRHEQEHMETKANGGVRKLPPDLQAKVAAMNALAADYGRRLG